jgi:hypothetical protein
MISFNREDKDNPKVIIEMTEEQAKLLFKLFGKIGGYANESLSIQDPREELNASTMRDKLINPLWNQLDDLFMFLK